MPLTGFRFVRMEHGEKNEKNGENPIVFNNCIFRTIWKQSMDHRIRSCEIVYLESYPGWVLLNSQDCLKKPHAHTHRHTHTCARWNEIRYLIIIYIIYGYHIAVTSIHFHFDVPYRSYPDPFTYSEYSYINFPTHTYPHTHSLTHARTHTLTDWCCWERDDIYLFPFLIYVSP